MAERKEFSKEDYRNMLQRSHEEMKRRSENFIGNPRRNLLLRLKNEALQILATDQFLDAKNREVQRRSDEHFSSQMGIDIFQTPELKQLIDYQLLTSETQTDIQRRLESELFDQVINQVFCLGEDGYLPILIEPDFERIPYGPKMSQHERMITLVKEAVLLTIKPDLSSLAAPRSNEYTQVNPRLLGKIEKIKTSSRSVNLYRFYLIYEKYIASPFDPHQQGIVIALNRFPQKKILEHFSYKFAAEVEGRSANQRITTDGQGINPLV